MDKRYDKEYWNRLERNWWRWKGEWGRDRRKLMMIKENKIKEIVEAKIEEWDKEDKMGKIRDLHNEL